MVFKGSLPVEEFARPKPAESGPERAIRAYGMGLLRLWEGDRAGARGWFEQLTGSGAWASFAAIAAEVELADLVKSAPDRTSPNSTLTAWILAWNLYDLDLASGLFSADPPPTYFSSEKAGRISGRDALQAHHQGFGFVPGGKAADSRLWLEDLEVRSSGAFATATATWLFDRDTGAMTPPQRGPVTFVLVGRPDGWLIVHAHFANDPTTAQAGS
jgi:ketosteroid isomerase-like protein